MGSTGRPRSSDGQGAGAGGFERIAGGLERRHRVTGRQGKASLQQPECPERERRPDHARVVEERGHADREQVAAALEEESAGEGPREQDCAAHDAEHERCEREHEQRLGCEERGGHGERDR